MNLSHQSIATKFDLTGQFVSSEEINCGLINTTFSATFKETDGTSSRYIFQRINSTVFPEPEKVMQNVEKVTQHIGKKKQQVGTRSDVQTLKLFPTHKQSFFHTEECGSLWRCYNFIEGGITFDECSNLKTAFQAALAFGTFIEYLSDFPALELHETIPHFHHTVRRYKRLLEVIQTAPNEQLLEVEQEIEFIKEREHLCSQFIDLADAQLLPIRVTHNDTKINNVMVDEKSLAAICVIDLDTVMPGIALYDFGDLVRTTISNHEEDTTDLNSINVRPEFFHTIARGYTEGCNNLTQQEVEQLPYAGKITALELAIRFLTDHLEGDVYFATNRPNHNLDRCRTQLKLVEQLETNEPHFCDFVKSITPYGE